MFHFPAFPPHGLYIQPRVTPHNMVPGFPIRKSWPQRPVIDSTRLIADSHVLHRLLMPRHPPCALKNFQHNHPSITDKRQHRKPQIHEQQNNQQNHKTTNTHTHKMRQAPVISRCSRSLYSSQTTTPHPHTTHPHQRARVPRTQENKHGLSTETPRTPHPPNGRHSMLVASKPNSAPQPSTTSTTTSLPTTSPHKGNPRRTHQQHHPQHQTRPQPPHPKSARTTTDSSLIFHP